MPTLALAAPGCFIELPERFGDAGPEPFGESDALMGVNAAPTGGTNAPPTGNPSVAPSRPAPGDPPSGGPPPTAPPTAAPTEPPSAPPGCVAGLCETCTEGGELVPIEADERCPDTSCAAFQRVTARRDPRTGGPVCEIENTRMPRTCSDARACLVASAETCLPDGHPVTIRGDTSCQDVAGCAVGQNPRVVNIPAGQLCVGGEGQCNGAGECRRNDECSRARLSLGEQFCAAADGLAAQNCRFHILPGSLDADPVSGDNRPELSCSTFCESHGWTCGSIWENLGTCLLLTPDLPLLSQVERGCEQTMDTSGGDRWYVADGMLCDCDTTDDAVNNNDEWE